MYHVKIAVNIKQTVIHYDLVSSKSRMTQDQYKT